MEQKEIDEGRRLMTSIAIVVEAAILSGFFIFNGLATSDNQERFDTVYGFEEGLTPVSVIYFSGVNDQLWLCQNAAGEYLECVPERTERASK